MSAFGGLETGLNGVPTTVHSTDPHPFIDPATHAADGMESLLDRLPVLQDELFDAETARPFDRATYDAKLRQLSSAACALASSTDMRFSQASANALVMLHDSGVDWASPVAQQSTIGETRQ